MTQSFEIMSEGLDAIEVGLFAGRSLSVWLLVGGPVDRVLDLVEGGGRGLETVADSEEVGIARIVENGAEIVGGIRSRRNSLDSSRVDVGVTMVLTSKKESFGTVDFVARLTGSLESNFESRHIDRSQPRGT